MDREVWVSSTSGDQQVGGHMELRGRNDRGSDTNLQRRNVSSLVNNRAARTSDEGMAGRLLESHWQTLPSIKRSANRINISKDLQRR